MEAPAGRRSGVGRATAVRREEPLDGVEDHIEPELELAVVAVARLEDVLGRQLHEVRVVLRTEPLQERLGTSGPLSGS